MAGSRLLHVIGAEREVAAPAVAVVPAEALGAEERPAHVRAAPPVQVAGAVGLAGLGVRAAQAAAGATWRVLNRPLLCETGHQRAQPVKELTWPPLRGARHCPMRTPRSAISRCAASRTSSARHLQPSYAEACCSWAECSMRHSGIVSSLIVVHQWPAKGHPLGLPWLLLVRFCSSIAIKGLRTGANLASVRCRICKVAAGQQARGAAAAAGCGARTGAGVPHPGGALPSDLARLAPRCTGWPACGELNCKLDQPPLCSLLCSASLSVAQGQNRYCIQPYPALAPSPQPSCGLLLRRRRAQLQSSCRCCK